MSEFANIIRGMIDTVADLHGITVIYTPVDGTCPLNLTASPTAINGAVGITDGIAMTETKTRDYLIRACDLRRGATQLMPQKGDTISELNDQGRANGYVYTVTQPAMADAPYRWVDRTRQVLRVHTKETAVPA